MNEVRIKELSNHIDDIKRSMNKVAVGMVEIGYHLQQIRDKGLEQEKGYVDIWTLASEEFGFTKSVTSRMISIFETYGEESYGLPKLKEQYSAFNKGQLIEMLNIREEIREEIPTSATVRDIRDTKAALKEEESQKSNDADDDLKDAEKAILGLLKKEEYALKFDDIFKLCTTDGMSIKEADNKMMMLLTGNGYKTTKAADCIILMKEKEVVVMKGSYKEILGYQDIDDIILNKMDAFEFKTAKECWESYYHEEYPVIQEEEEPEHEQEPEQIKTKAVIKKKQEQEPEETPIPGQVDMDGVAEKEHIGPKSVATSQQEIKKVEESPKLNDVEEDLSEPETVEAVVEEKEATERFRRPVSNLGTIHLPREYRRALGIEPNDDVIIRLQDSKMTIEKAGD